MARRAAFALVLAALAAWAAPSARAQALARLTVVSFALSADTNDPVAGVPFHLVVTLQTRQQVAQIGNIDLPVLAQLDLLGDERQTVAGPSGTQYREAITVVARAPGTVEIAPATLQAIDARDGRAKQWFTNGLELHVRANGATQARAGAQAVWAVGQLVLHALLWLLGIGCIGALAMLLFRRRHVAAPPAPVAAAEPPARPAAAPSPTAELEDALAVLRAERTRAAAESARSAARRMVGAGDGETLADVLARPQCSGNAMRDLLTSLERSAFTHDGDLQAAIDDGIASIEAYLRGQG